MSYASVGEAMVTRILESMRLHPEVAQLDDAWGLFKVPGFKCDDLGPTYAQAAAALARAKQLYAKETNTNVQRR